MKNPQKPSNFHIVPRKKPTVQQRAAKDKVLKERIGSISLPERNIEVLFIPNRIAEAGYDYTLFEERTLNFILLALQDAIRLSMNNKPYQQLDLFQPGTDSLFIDIPMNKITSPNQYQQLRKTAVELGKTEVHIYLHDEKLHRTVFLFQGVDTWANQERSNTLRVKISHEVAELIIEVEKNRVGKPMHYTSFLLEAANIFTTKYGSRIYKMISGWKEKGSYYIPLEDFRKRLGLGKRYPRYTDIKKNILLPVQLDIEKNRDKFDCWFDCNEEGFAVRDGNTVVGILFKIHTVASTAIAERKVEYCKALLIEHFGFTAAHLAELQPVFTSPFMDTERILQEILRLATYCAENGAKIRDKPRYIIECILRIFDEVRQVEIEGEN